MKDQLTIVALAFLLGMTVSLLADLIASRL
jgi:hypothetical protein